MAAFRDRLRGLLFFDGVVLAITQQIAVGQGRRGGYRFDRGVGGISPLAADRKPTIGADSISPPVLALMTTHRFASSRQRGR